MSCRHPKRSFFKFKTRVGFHIVERCDSCRMNVNGTGNFVSASYAGVRDPSLLPDDPLHGRTAPINAGQTDFKW